MTDSPKAFSTFYRDVFLPEHQQPLNVALHIFGTLAGLAWIAATLAAPGFWKFAVLLFPVVHGAPGLIGHRLVERSEAVGDARWRRRDYPAPPAGPAAPPAKARSAAPAHRCCRPAERR